MPSLKLLLKIVLLLTLLVGCTSLPKQTTQQTVLPLQYWDISARMAFKSPEESFSATLDWHHLDNVSNVRLSKLLGGTLLTMNLDGTGASLTMDDKQYRDRDAERLLYELTGWLIPINEMHQWVQGFAPETSEYQSIEKNPNGTIKSMQSHAGWQVSYQRYQQVGQLLLPSDLTIKREKLRIKLRINDWSI